MQLGHQRPFACRRGFVQVIDRAFPFGTTCQRARIAKDNQSGPGAGECQRQGVRTFAKGDGTVAVTAQY